MAVSPEEQAFINDLPKAKITKRLPDCPAERLAQCRGESVPPASDNNFAAGQWREGSPPHPWDSEWFLAQLHDGSYAVLRPLPEEFTYDFSTADATYLMRHKVKRWAQLSDSNYVEPECKAVPPAGDVEVLDLFEQVIGKDPQAYLAGSTVYQVTESEVLAFASTHVTRLTADLTSANADKAAYAQNAIDLRERCTKLTAERDALKAEVERQIARSNDFASKWSGADAKAGALQSELTKAREIIQRNLRQIVVDECERTSCGNANARTVLEIVDDFIAHQSTPAALNQTGEQS